MDRRQTIPAHLRLTLETFLDRFPDDETCLEYLKEKRYPNGKAYCEKCEKERKHHRVTGRPAYACDYCGSMISPMAGTIFEHSSTSLRKWFYAMYLMGSTRCGISAKQIQRETGVTYKTAWRMFKQIRSLLSEPDMQLEGTTVEMDETYVGGRRHRKYQARRGRPSPNDPSKTCVVGAVERKGRVFACVANDATKATFHGVAKERVLPESVIFTDEHHSYTGLDKMGYTHQRIQHSQGVYVLGNVHTNTIEGFWSLVKRGIAGVYHNVSKKYLQTYLDEYSFRYNRRDQGNLIFTSILERVFERAV
ncbi:MAG TPA: IS1595 family transposase [Candidatus Sulfotelmatobacter sp.]|nr:IS1595 family transposase [Candidatus Sulfotelmatobacter sp.]